MTTCPECGHANMPGVAFCDECGHDLSTVSAATSSPPVVNQPVLTEPVAASPMAATAAADPFGDPFGDPFASTPVTEVSDQITTVAAPENDPVAAVPPVSAPVAASAAPLPASPPSVPVVASTQTAPSTASLTIERNGQIGHRFAVTNPTLIGKWDMDAGNFPEIDTTNEDPDVYISRKHALIEQQGGQWTIKDLGSTNGTALNRQKLTPQEPRPLSDGDELIVGRLFLRFQT